MRYINADDKQKESFVADLVNLFDKNGEPVMVQKNGETVAMLLNPEEFALYEAFKKQQAQDFLDACDAMAAEAQANGLTEEILAEILND